MEDGTTPANNPVRAAEKQSLAPGFLDGDEGKGKKINEAGDSKVSGADGKTGAVGDLKNAENAGAEGLYKNGSGVGGGLYNADVKKNIANKAKAGKGKFNLKRMAVPTFLMIAVGLLLLPIVILGSPMLMIGAIDYNLQDSLGFSGTVAIIEQQGLSVLSEMAANGEMPAGFAGDLAEAGILVGQVTATGDFVRTNNYIADIDDNLEVAASGFDYHRHGADGELAFLFDNEVVNASDFVATIESNPKMYAAYSEALDVSARFYYGSDVSAVYKELGLTRGAFNGWKATGDDKADEESFYSILEKTLKGDISATMYGCYDENNCEETGLSTGGNASDIVSGAVAASNNAEKAAQLLNSAISAGEPRQAAKAFLALEEPIQRARIDGDGPVNQVMNALTRPTEIEYVDVNTQEMVKVNKSILETTNFTAAVSGGGYSISEANNFSRDRVLVATDMMNNDDIVKTTVNDSNSSTSTALERGSGGGSLTRAEGSVAMATAEFNTDIYSSVVGGNRIVEGGSYLSNAINTKTLGAMPSDAATIAKYQRETDTALARKAEADRATLSPFDVSSPNTFLGSIVHGFATALVRHTNSGQDGVNVVSVVGAAMDMAGDSVNGLLGDAKADGSNQKFTTLAGNCTTVNKAANVEGDIYCNSHNTISTKYMNYTTSQWESALGGELDSGQPAEKGGLANFITYGADRETTVGVKSAAICERWKENNKDLAGDAADWIAGIFGVYGACQYGTEIIDDDIALGSGYTLSSSNGNAGSIEKYSGWMLYDTVSALIKDSQSSVSKFREEYYKKHPKDDSPAGQIARMSGMTKAEAQLALDYASYLTMVANYNPLERFAFGGPIIKIDEPMMLVEDEQIKENIYCYWCGKMEFAELRNRNYAA